MSDLYQRIATLYHLVYADWEASISRQARSLDAVCAERLGAGSLSIRDVSCGIGTQALGLAALGHGVVGSDLAPAAIERARREALNRGLAIEWSVGDMRDCARGEDRRFDVVLSADNSVPHLLDDDSIATAFTAMHAITRPGGLVVLSVRDYVAEDRSPLQLRPFGVRQIGDERILVFQRWAFHADARHYSVAMYFVTERDGAEPEIVVGESRYYAVTVDVLRELLESAGFVDIERIDGRFFQPLLVGRRPEES